MADKQREDGCPVCLKEFGNSRIGKLPCGHIFCSSCIEEWSKILQTFWIKQTAQYVLLNNTHDHMNMNTCPVDRKKFYCIKLYLQLNGKCIGEMKVEERNIGDLLTEDDNVVCQVCHLMDREDLLLLCDGCDQGFHTYCLEPPLGDVPEGTWYCTRCLPIVTSVESLSDNCYHSNSDIDDSSDGNIATLYYTAQRRSGRISSDSSSDDDDGSNYSVDNEIASSLPSSHVTSDNGFSVTMTTDLDSSASQQCSNSSEFPVTDSNHDSDISSPQRGYIASRIRIAYSNQPTSSHDCLVTENDNRNQSLSELNVCSHGDNIKRRLRNHRNGHRVCMQRYSTGSFKRCILSVTDSEQSDSEYLPPCHSCPSSRSHAHNEMHQLKSSPKSHKTNPTTPRRANKRHRKKSRSKKGKNKRRKLWRHPLKQFLATPTRTTRRARTAATSPRVNEAGTDTPQSAIRQLAMARCQTASLEEARKMTQNDVIAHQVRSRQQQQQQQAWWDRKVIDCYKSNSIKVVCSPLKNAIKRHPLISSASRKHLGASHEKQQKQRCEKTTSDVIGDIFTGMNTLYNKDAVILRSGKVTAPSTSKK